MSDTVKLIIEIPKEAKQAFDNAESNDLKGGYYDHGGIIGKAIQNGIPLDDVKAGIEDCSFDHYFEYGEYIGENPIQHRICMTDKVLDILDNIGKTNKRSKIRCNTCKNNDDELSGECYECVKGIFDHYEPEENKTEVENGRTND